MTSKNISQTPILTMLPSLSTRHRFAPYSKRIPLYNQLNCLNYVAKSTPDSSVALYSPAQSGLSQESEPVLDICKLYSLDADDSTLVEQIAQQAIEAIVWHFTLSPAQMYGNLVNRVSDYVYINAESLHLPEFKNDLVISNSIREFIKSKVSDMKSTWADEVKKLVQPGASMTLDDFAVQTMRTHYTRRYQQLTQEHLGFFALMRLACFPSIDDALVELGGCDRRLDGFWSVLEIKLAAIHHQLGTDRHTDEWKSWLSSMINLDYRIRTINQGTCEPATDSEDELHSELSVNELIAKYNLDELN
ncbi:hypothetical protein BT96DRAFT_1000041 [Gymnopus androsaceus JB14]|uniref:Uncharacterized protein n=1 Tax=Gymnopus androsaceus JB14 TaxID=1447944 RepID=A0A6A4H4T8_9AGAR|nr:hypothetical protein BT96DRAFT_1000041 [Gymnopus androsaceus JB14]